jgi:hypothetical protein
MVSFILMTKRDTLFLLLPSALLILVAVRALSVAPAFSFVPRIEQRREQDFERFVAKVQSGEMQPTKEKWIELLRGSREVGAKVATELEKGHAALTRTLAASTSFH